MITAINRSAARTLVATGANDEIFPEGVVSSKSSLCAGGQGSRDCSADGGLPGTERATGYQLERPVAPRLKHAIA
jgi:hypothetical protein